jgi:hypothetical protein
MESINQELSDLLTNIVKGTLEQKVYPFGFKNYQGLGNKVASGRLKNSVKVTTMFQQEKLNRIEVYIGELYGEFVQAGRLPNNKGVPIAALEAWIKARRIKGRDKKGKFITNKSLAFAIQTNIKKFGIRPANYLDRSFEKIEQNQRILDLIGDEGVNELYNKIQVIFGQNNENIK